MAYYAKELPLDKNRVPYPGIPANVSTQATIGVPTASSVLTFNAGTTVVDVTVLGGQAGNAAIIGKWGTASVTATNFDFVVSSGQSRTFVIPVSVMGTASIAGDNVRNGLYPAVALKVGTAASASVFTAEY